MPERDGCMRRIYNMSTGVCGDFAVRDAASCLAAGALALLPTETVYGVGVAVAAYGQCAELPVEGSGYRRISRSSDENSPRPFHGSWQMNPLSIATAWMCLALPMFLLMRLAGCPTIVVKASDEVPLYMQAADGTVALCASACGCVRASRSLHAILHWR